MVRRSWVSHSILLLCFAFATEKSNFMWKCVVLCCVVHMKYIPTCIHRNEHDVGVSTYNEITAPNTPQKSERKWGRGSDRTSERASERERKRSSWRERERGSEVEGTWLVKVWCYMTSLMYERESASHSHKSYKYIYLSIATFDYVLLSVFIYRNLFSIVHLCMAMFTLSLSFSLSLARSIAFSITNAAAAVTLYIACCLFRWRRGQSVIICVIRVLCATNQNHMEMYATNSVTRHPTLVVTYSPPSLCSIATLSSSSSSSSAWHFY